VWPNYAALRGFHGAIPNPKERSMTKISIKHGLEVVDSQPYGNLNGVLRSWSATEEQSRRPQTAGATPSH
jgi:hypothetical protein